MAIFFPDAPAVSVILPVHNGAEYVEPAIASICGQSLTEIEIIVVDDASSDATPDILAKAAARDDRIRIIRLDQNAGLPVALNTGLDVARAPLIARMDADDLSHPDRLKRQKDYMTAHPDLLLLATSVERIDANGRVFRRRSTPMTPDALRWIARFQTPVIHPTFMFRTHLPDGTAVRYGEDWDTSQDYDLCRRLLQAGACACLPDILLQYRDHPNALSSTRHLRQKELARRIAGDIQARELPSDLATGGGR